MVQGGVPTGFRDLLDGSATCSQGLPDLLDLLSSDLRQNRAAKVAPKEPFQNLPAAAASKGHILNRYPDAAGFTDESHRFRHMGIVNAQDVRRCSRNDALGLQKYRLPGGWLSGKQVQQGIRRKKSLLGSGSLDA